jgi:SAM-dependent methyltransferase
MSKELKIVSPSENVSMADEWFEIANKDHFWMRWRFKVIVKKLKAFAPLNSEMKFLEIGCGHGQFLEQCKGTLPISIDGSDLNVFALKQIENTQGDIFVYNVFDRNKDLLNKYDGAFLLDVIEHIEDDSSFLKAAVDHVKPGGLIVINVPALSLLFSKYDVVAGHKRRYTKKKIEKLLIRAGIRPVSISYWGLLMLPIALARKIYLRFVPNESVIKTGFKASPLANTFFNLPMGLELFFGGSTFLGTSVLALGRKS